MNNWIDANKMPPKSRSSIYWVISGNGDIEICALGKNWCTNMDWWEPLEGPDGGYEFEVKNTKYIEVKRPKSTEL